jgi:hypothetical protein
VSADFSTAQPDFTAALLGVTSRSLLAAGAHNDVQQNPADPGPGWALTDYATAVALGMTPVAIENGSGEFVAPTPETMAAALDGMIHEPDGRLTPDPNASAAGAYPLTTVEYAMAPAEQLVDDSCASRPHAQELLRTWLDYLTGPAQSSLPTGFVALPDSLREQAPAAIAKVGASPTTCGVPAAPGGPGTTPPDRPSATPTASADATARSSAGAGLGAGDGLLDADALALTASAAELAAAADAADAAEPELPPVFGIIPVSRVLAPAALLLTVALTSMAALVTSGRPILPRRRPPAAPG